MFFDLGDALSALADLGPTPVPRSAAAARRGDGRAPQPFGLYPLACGPRPERLGIRVPELSGALEPLSATGRPVLQSSANLSGGADARRLEDVDPRVKAGVDVLLDAGELPGTPSTVVDLSLYEADGGFEVLREGRCPPRGSLRSSDPGR